MKAKLINLIWILTMCLFIVLTVFSVVQRVSGTLQPMFMGWGIAFVKTGSMEPTIPVGSMVLIHEQNSYSCGDIVIYPHESGNFTVTHRIIYMNDGLVVTRGDANKTADPSFLEEQIIGKIILWIPYVGYAFAALKNPIILISVLGFFVFLLYLDNRKTPSKKQTPSVI